MIDKTPFHYFQLFRFEGKFDFELKSCGRSWCRRRV